MKTHNFTRKALGWGWNLCGWYPSEDRTKAKLMAVGRGVKQGDELLLEFPSGVKRYAVESISYHTNPTDLFDAVVIPTQQKGT